MSGCCIIVLYTPAAMCAVHACCGCGWFCCLLQEDVAAALNTVKEACDLQDLPYRCVLQPHSHQRS